MPAKSLESCALAFLLIISTNVVAQQWISHTRYQGLGGGDVRDLLIDQNGDLWAGTDEGLSRFDGAWKIFREPNGLANNLVQTLALDTDGNIWIGTRGGINKIDPRSDLSDPRNWKKYTRANTGGGLASDSILTIAFDQQGRIWFGTEDRGISVANPNFMNSMFPDPLFDPTSWNTYNRENSALGSNKILDLAVDAAGNVWAATAASVNLFAGDQNQWLPFVLAPRDANAKARVLFRDRDDYMWIGTQLYGVYRVQPGNLSRPYDHFTTPGAEDGQDDVFAIAQEREGLMWLGHRGGSFTPMGVTLIDPDSNWSSLANVGSWESFTSNDGLANNQINAIVVDEEDNVWFSHSESRGVTQLEKTWQTLPFLTSGSQGETNFIEGLFSGGENDLWLATRSGAARIDLRRSLLLIQKSDNFLEFDRLLFETIDGLSSDHVFTVFRDHGGYIWFGTSRGADRAPAANIDEANTYQAFNPQNGLAASPVYWITEDRLGYLWFATGNKGVSRVHADSVNAKQNWRTLTKANGLADDQVLMMLLDRQGYLWFATSKGAGRLDPARDPREPANWQTFTATNGLASDRVRFIFEDSAGLLWFATDAGVCRVDPRTDLITPANWKCYTERDGLANNFVTAIAQLRPDEYWFGTAVGASKFAPGTTVEPWKTVLLTPRVSSNFVTGLHADSTNGALWFGTDGGGAIRYQPTSRAPNTSLITRYDLVTTNTVHYEFSGADAITPTSMLRYQYRVNAGLWISTNNNFAEIFLEASPNDNRPRRYLFEVRAIDDDDNIDQTSVSDGFFKIAGALGGSFQSEDGLVELYVPPNALGADTSITITPMPQSQITDSLVISAYDISARTPELRKPGSLRMKVTNTAGGRAIFREENSSWVSLGGTKTSRGDSLILTTAISRFGRYAVRRAAAAPVQQDRAVAQVSIQPRVFSPAGAGANHGDRANISFSLRQAAPVSIRIYDLNGRLKRAVLSEAAMAAGVNSVPWDGRDEDNRFCVSGLYVVTIAAAGDLQTHTVAISNARQ